MTRVADVVDAGRRLVRRRFCGARPPQEPRVQRGGRCRDASGRLRAAVLLLAAGREKRLGPATAEAAAEAAAIEGFTGLLKTRSNLVIC